LICHVNLVSYTYRTHFYLTTFQFNLNGSTVKGKLIKKSPRGPHNSPLWIVAPSDRRRKNEEVPEKALGRLILEETSNNVKPNRLGRTSTRDNSSTYSDESVEDVVPQANSPRPTANTRRNSIRGTGSGSSEENSKKRKSDESKSSTANNRKPRKVTFKDKAAALAAKKKRVVKKAVRGAGTIGTRSTRANGVLLSELPTTAKGKKITKNAAVPKIKQNEDVKVIKMLTGTLYLYRGETRRAEFVRTKY
jgi:hypothetical protein